MSNRQIKSILISFRNAARGVVYCIQNERNMRIHMVVACYIVAFQGFFNLSKPEFALMLCAIALVLAMEMVNTAIEVLVDLESPAYNSLARIAKDIAAGAVFVCALFAFAIGLLLFWQPPVLLHIVHFLGTSMLWGTLLLLSVPVALLFVFWGPVKIGRFFTAHKRP